MFALHALFHKKQKAHTKSSINKRLFIGSNEEKEFLIQVEPNSTLEVALAQNWSSLGETTLTLNVEFCGPLCLQSSVLLSSAKSVSRIDVQALNKTEKLNLSGSLNSWEQVLFPNDKETRISPLLKPRDVLPDGSQIYQLTLSYNFELGEKTSIVPYAPLLCDFLYESEFESQLWMIYNSNKKLVSVGDFHPKSVSFRAGTYTIRYQIRHEDPKKLELLQEMPIILSRTLGKKISLSVHDSFQNAITNSGKVTKAKVSKGEVSPFFVRLPSDAAKSLPKKGVSKGTSFSLKGEFVINTYEGEGHSQLSIPVIVSDLSAIEKAVKNKNGKQRNKSTISDVHRDTIVKWMSTLEGAKFDEAYTKYGSEILQENPNHLPLLALRLKNIDFSDSKKRTFEVLQKVTEESTNILDLIDRTTLAAFFGVRRPSSDEESETEQEMNSTKDILVDVLNRKALALLELRKLQPEQKEVDYSEQYHSTLTELKRWVDVEKDSKYRVLYLQELAQKKEYGKILRILLKTIHDQDSPMEKQECFEKLIEVLDKLEWIHWKDYYQTWMLREFPKEYQLF